MQALSQLSYGPRDGKHTDDLRRGSTEGAISGQLSAISHQPSARIDQTRPRRGSAALRAVAATMDHPRRPAGHARLCEPRLRPSSVLSPFASVALRGETRIKSQRSTASHLRRRPPQCGGKHSPPGRAPRPSSLVPSAKLGSGMPEPGSGLEVVWRVPMFGAGGAPEQAH